MPERYRELGQSYELRGDSVIIDPRGEVIAGPAKGETILLAKCSREALLAAKSALDLDRSFLNDCRPDTMDTRQVVVSVKPSSFQPSTPPIIFLTGRPIRASRAAARSAPLHCGPAQ
jgi:nitrilase